MSPPSLLITVKIDSILLIVLNKIDRDSGKLKFKVVPNLPNPHQLMGGTYVGIPRSCPGLSGTNNNIPPIE